MPNQHFTSALFANFFRFDDGLTLRRGIIAEQFHSLIEFRIELRTVIFYRGNFLHTTCRDLANLRLRFRGRIAPFALPAHAIATFRW